MTDTLTDFTSLSQCYDTCLLPCCRQIYDTAFTGARSRSDGFHGISRKKGVQIVFCDIAINEDSEHFSVYEAIKEDLIKRGIPRDEICFAGDAKNRSDCC